MGTARQQRQSPSNRQEATPAANMGGGDNSQAMADLQSSEAEPSLLSAVAGGEGLHAAACACASCLGGMSAGVHPSFTHTRADGTVTNEVLGPEAAQGDETAAASGTEAPSLDGPAGAEAAQSGGMTFGRHPQFPAIYGQTFYSEASLPTFPRLHFEFGRTWGIFGDYTCKAKPTTWMEPEFPALATPENAGEGYLVDQPQAQYPGYAHYVLVSGSAATNIAIAEDQHVQDLFMGWNLTANKIGDAINASAAGDGQKGPDATAARTACIDAIVASLGDLGTAIRGKLESGGEISMVESMNKAFAATQKARDASGKHSFGLVLYAAHADGKRVASMVDDSKSIDMTPSSTVINNGTIL